MMFTRRDSLPFAAGAAIALPFAQACDALDSGSGSTGELLRSRARLQEPFATATNCPSRPPYTCTVVSHRPSTTATRPTWSPRSRTGRPARARAAQRTSSARESRVMSVRSTSPPRRSGTTTTGWTSPGPRSTGGSPACLSPATTRRRLCRSPRASERSRSSLSPGPEVERHEADGIERKIPSRTGSGRHPAAGRPVGHRACVHKELRQKLRPTSTVAQDERGACLRAYQASPLQEHTPGKWRGLQ
jgi:hypothetical protein